MEHRVLLLNADAASSPISILPWEQAVEMLYEEKVVVVAAYPDLFIRSQYTTIPRPAVVQLVRYSPARASVSFAGPNVFARDNFTCAYCGVVRPRRGRGTRTALTIDHVVPRSRAVRGKVRLPSGTIVGAHSWLNVVTACGRCNHAKAAMTPAEANMPLLFQPRVPAPGEALRILAARYGDVPAPWEPYLGTRP